VFSYNKMCCISIYNQIMDTSETFSMNSSTESGVEQPTWNTDELESVLDSNIIRMEKLVGVLINNGTKVAERLLDQTESKVGSILDRFRDSFLVPLILWTVSIVVVLVLGCVVCLRVRASSLTKRKIMDHAHALSMHKLTKPNQQSIPWTLYNDPPRGGFGDKFV
jgi:hypothetical protein